MCLRVPPQHPVCEIPPVWEILPISLAPFPAHVSHTSNTALSLSSSPCSHDPHLHPSCSHHPSARSVVHSVPTACGKPEITQLNPEPLGCPGPAAGIWDDLSRNTGGAKCLCSEVWLLEGLAIMLMSRCVRELSQRVWVSALLPWNKDSS